MHFESYSSHEEMMEALREHQRHAMAGLHPSQVAIGAGDHWVRFVDLDATPPLVEFGRVFTDEEVLMSELQAGQASDRAIFNLGAVQHARDEQGLLFGTAWSVWTPPEGVVGNTHKASVWPIEQRLFDLAVDHSFRLPEFEELERFLLDLAFRQHRAHWRSTQEKK